MLMLTTSLVDLTNGLELILGPLQRLRVPVNELVLVFVIAIKFVPVFIEEMERLARAQTARGVPFDEGGAITRARRIGRLLVPIFIGGFARADTLTIAMNTRSYRGGTAPNQTPPDARKTLGLARPRPRRRLDDRSMDRVEATGHRHQATGKGAWSRLS